MPEATISLGEAATAFGVPVVRLGRWCATGKIRCERDADGWLIPTHQADRISDLIKDHDNALADQPVRALAVPAHEASSDLAAEVTDRLGLGKGAVTVTPFALDGIDYLVAVWRAEPATAGGLLRLRELAADLHADLLDGAIVERAPSGH